MGLLNGTIRFLFVAFFAIGHGAVAKDCSDLGPVTHNQAIFSVHWCGTSDVKDEDLDELKETFLQAYDGAGSSYVAEHCFEFEDVTVEKVPFMRRLDENSTITFDFSIWFRFVFTCFDCPENILSNDGSRLLNVQEQSGAEALMPTQSDFVQRYNELLNEKGICVNSLESESVVDMHLSPSFRQFVAVLPCLVTGLLSLAILF